MLILAPSILGADFARLGEEIRAADRAGARYLHLDVMDGAFVPSISFGMPLIEKIRKTTDMVFDVHMMVEEPGRYVADMRKAGADIITVHAEACRHLDRTLHQIHETGARAGVAINPATPLSAIEWVWGEADMVLQMTVNPGFGGQKLIPYTLEKVRRLREAAEAAGHPIDIEVDGGISASNIREAVEAGANVIVAGSAVFQGDTEANARELLRRMGAK